MQRRQIWNGIIALVLGVVALEPVTAQSRTELQKSSAEVKRVAAELATSVQHSIVEIRKGERTVALGTAVGSPGFVITKASEIQGEGELQCRLWDQRTLLPEVVATDEQLDLALLRVAADDLVPVDLSMDRQPTAGNFLVSIGASGQPMSLSVVEVDPREFNIRHAKPSERGYLGVNCSSDEENGGLVVQQVTPDSGARRAGIRKGDIIVSVDNQPVTLVEHLVRQLREHKVGDDVQLVVVRGTEKMNVQAKLGVMPAMEPYDQWGGGPFSKRRFGFESVIVHDASLSPIQIGGPLVDTDGRVVGINIARALRVASYAHPAHVVRNFVQENLAKGAVPSSLPE